MGDLIVILVIVFVLLLALRPIIRHHKNKGNGEYGCYKCSQSSKCNGCKK